MEGDLTGALLGGRYRVGKQLGRGGMGVVYEAVQEALGRRVAIKVIHPELARDAELVQRFHREAQAAAALGHPNIVQVTDFDRGGEGPAFLVMEYLAGASLAGVIEAHGRLPAARVAFIASQALAALGAAHRAGIVHRDVKPDNVFLTSVAGVSDIVKVLDFGVAKVDGASATGAPNPRLTSTGAMIGTPAYMAPEQARGRDVDARADLYAMGACMYHALSGALPFAGTSYNALLFAIAEDVPPSLASHRSDLDPALIEVVERALRKDPAARFQSAKEMRDALAPWAQPSTGDGESIEARLTAPPDPTAPTQVASASPKPSGPVVVHAPVISAPPPASSRWLVLGLAAIALVAIGAALFFAGRSMRPFRRAAQPPPPPETHAHHEEPRAPETHAHREQPPPMVLPSAAPPTAPGSTKQWQGRGPTGGRTVVLAGMITHNVYKTDYVRKIAANHAGSFNACYRAAEFDPVDHQFVDYAVEVSAEGRITSVSPAGAAARSVALDACMKRAIGGLNLGPPDLAGGGKMLLSFTSRVRE